MALQKTGAKNCSTSSPALFQFAPTTSPTAASSGCSTRFHVKPGEIPVVGWGNSLDTTQEVLNGYVNAAQWQDPQATSYVALSLAAMAASGIPPGFNIITGALYEKDKASIYDHILSGK